MERTRYTEVGTLPGTAAIRDNLATHKTAQAAEAMGTAGCRFPVLPSKNPDPTPMEMAFSKPEAQLRRIGARTFSDMVDALAEIRDLFTLEEGWNYFCDAGYASG